MGARDRAGRQRCANVDVQRLQQLAPQMKHFLFVSAAAVAAALAAPLSASSPKFFQSATQADFLKGAVENLSMDSHGQLVLGPARELIYETSAPFLWAMVAESDGTLFVGTGNEGKVFKIDPQGKGSLFFDSSELEVH